MDKIDICSLTLSRLKEFLYGFDVKPYTAGQVYTWLHRQCVSDFDDMTNLSKPLRSKLKENSRIASVKIRKKQVSADGTVKYLYELFDGNCIETVLMRYRYGNTVCVSTQVGCRMGCHFCASTQSGKIRNLSSGEILWQIYRTQKDTGEKVSNIVMMGIGEPLDNFDNSADFIRIISSQEGQNISRRNITLSTCGLIKGIHRLGQLNLGITLSVSLHAATDEKRKQIMPIANVYSLDELISACREYARLTGRRISFEYAMIRGVNDTSQDAYDLKNLLGGMMSHINLIPVNPVDGSPYTSSDERRIKGFAKKLAGLGMNVTVRRRLGQDISAACGQLRNENR